MEQIDTYSLIEKVKCDLSLKHDFNLMDAFKMFDVNNDG